MDLTVYMVRASEQANQHVSQVSEGANSQCRVYIMFDISHVGGFKLTINNPGVTIVKEMATMLTYRRFCVNDLRRLWRLDA